MAATVGGDGIPLHTGLHGIVVDRWIFCGASEHVRRAKSLEIHSVKCVVPHLWTFLNFKIRKHQKSKSMMRTCEETPG